MDSFVDLWIIGIKLIQQEKTDKKISNYCMIFITFIYAKNQNPVITVNYLFILLIKNYNLS